MNELKLNESITIRVIGFNTYEVIKDGIKVASGMMSTVKRKAGVKAIIGGRVAVSNENFDKIVAFEKQVNELKDSKVKADVLAEGKANSAKTKQAQFIKNWENENY